MSMGKIKSFSYSIVQIQIILHLCLPGPKVQLNQKLFGLYMLYNHPQTINLDDMEANSR